MQIQDKTSHQNAAPRGVFAWALYDFANTVFSMNIISRYFPLWVTQGHSAPDIYFSATLSISMLLVAVTSPALGAMSDTTGRRLGPLMWLTGACAAATALIGPVDSLLTGLILFAAANFCYQSAMTFYYGLLPSVSEGSSASRVAGYGVSLGYLGAIAALAMAMPVESVFGNGAVYPATALMYLAFSIPMFRLLRDPAPVAGARVDIIGAFRTLARTFAGARRNRSVFIFLGANFLILDAVHTVIAFMAIYASSVVGFESGELNIFLMTSTVGAAGGSLLWGWAAHRWSPLRTFGWVCGMWLFTMLLASVSVNKDMFWMVGPLAGAALGGVWVAGRSALAQMAPADRIGEYFGLYNMAGKAAAIVGPMTWGAVVYIFSPLGGTIPHRMAILSLAVFIAAGWRALRHIEYAGAK
ncbi:MAG: MFS transporter [Nitrospinae bacterium]|nr:MFS transporter [Nitrospinota bacterium]